MPGPLVAGASTVLRWMVPVTRRHMRRPHSGTWHRAGGLAGRVAGVRKEFSVAPAFWLRARDVRL